MTDPCILLVEDNASDEELTLRALRKHRVAGSVSIARDGAEAIDRLQRTLADLPSVVFLDLNLPKLGGLDVLRMIRADERTRTLPVVILTSSSEHRDLVRGYGLGANSYIVKPVDSEQFSETVRRLGEYWVGLNQPVPREPSRPPTPRG